MSYRMYNTDYRNNNDIGQSVRTSEGCRDQRSVDVSGEAATADTEYVFKDKTELKRDAKGRQDEELLQKRAITVDPPRTRIVLDNNGVPITTISSAGSTTTRSVESPVSSLDVPGSRTMTTEDFNNQPTSVTTAASITPFDPFTTTATTTAASSQSASSVATSLASLSNKGTNSGGLSQSSKIGLGVGLGVGLSLLLATIAFFCLALRRKRKAMEMGGAKYTPHGQSDLSMIEQSHPIQMKAEQSQPAEWQPLQAEYHAQQPDLRHSQAYYEIPPRPAGVFEARDGQSPVTPIEPDTRGSGSAGVPLALAIPEIGRPSGVSRDASPVRSHSPVSPVSPVFAVSPAVNSRPPSPKA